MKIKNALILLSHNLYVDLYGDRRLHHTLTASNDLGITKG